jgi:hypothetical protein
MSELGALKARRRLVSFRLTEEELENLRLACLMRGARNVSDFARGAVLELSQERIPPGEQLLERFTALERKVEEMQADLGRNGDMLRALLKAVANAPWGRAAGSRP